MRGKLKCAHKFPIFAVRPPRRVGDQSHDEPIDQGLINVNKDDQVRCWTEHLGITERELRGAVGKVGLSADKVRDFVRPPSQ